MDRRTFVGRVASGVLAMPLGGGRLPGIAAGDIGKCAYGIFKAGQQYIGKTVGIAGEHLTGAQMAASLGSRLLAVCATADVVCSPTSAASPASSFRSAR